MSVWRVLLVDDSPLVRNAMQAALEPYGLDLVHAENGQIAVDRALATSWDLIFLDVVMPIMDGPTALRQIRARGNTTPVVLVTSVSTAAVVASAVKLGGVSYIAKPFTPDQIRAIAARMLKLDGHLLHTPRVVLQHTDPALPARLRRLLPAHVQIDPSPTLAATLDLAELGPRDLVLFESRDLADERVRVANLIRRALPAAGIFAVTDAADPAAPWQPDEGLDGMVPHALEDTVVRGFLYANFLRPLVVVHGAVARASGFLGPAPHQPAYLSALSRALIDRCGGLDPTLDLQIDLTRMPDDVDAVTTLIEAVHRGLRGTGPTPAFRLGAALHTAADRLPGVVVLRA